MRLITSDDVTDVIAKGKQRGLNFLLSKLTLDKLNRTKSAFDDSAELRNHFRFRGCKCKIL